MVPPPPITRLAVAGSTVLLAAAVAASCAAASGSTEPAGDHRLAPPAAGAHAGEKPPLVGLLDMGVQTPYQLGQPFPVTDPDSLDGYAGAFSGIVVNESWSQLEPSSGRENWRPLDESLAAVSAWNAAHPSTPLGVKLRIFAGRSAPSWLTAKTKTVTISVHGRLVEVGRWWTPAFESAWHQFEQALAARYDTNPLVRQVSVSSCSSSTGEPFVVSGARLSQRNLRAAGWSPQAQEACLSKALSDYSGWKRTPITFAFNPLPTGHGPDATFMDQLMDACASSARRGGPVCIVGSNDLSPSVASGRFSGPAISQIQKLEMGPDPPGVYFQTVGAEVVCQTIRTGMSYGAQSIELWPPNGRYLGFGAQSLATLLRWNQALKAGRTLTCA